MGPNTLFSYLTNVPQATLLSLLEGVLKTLPISLYAKDRFLRYIWVNDAFCRTFDVTPEQCAGAFIEDIFPDSASMVLAAMDRETLHSGQPCETIADLPCSAAASGRFHLRKIPHCDAAGQVQVIIGVITDIGQVERLTADATARERQYRLVFENSTGPLLLLDSKTMTIVEANPAAAALFKTNPAELLGRPVAQLLPLIRENDFRRTILDHLKTRRPLVTAFAQADGGRRDVSLQLDAMTYRKRRIILVNMRDVTDELKAQEMQKNFELQLHQAQKMESLGLLASGMAHDFNNFLSPILMNAEIIKDELGQDSPLAEETQEIIDAALNARNMVETILKFSRKDKLVSEPVSLSEIIRRTVKMMRSSLPDHVQLATQIAAEPAMISGDPTQFQQLLLNLLTNAAHAIGNTPGHIVVSLRHAPAEAENGGAESRARLVLRVEDDGCGMPVEIQDRIFEPFFTTKGSRQGTGMGLAIVHGIVQRHGGRIALQSALGEGTKFEINFPERQSEIDMPHMTTSPELSGCAGARILIVDDEQSILRSMTRALEKNGFAVSACASGTEAASLLDADPWSFDLIITDYAMPGMNGVDLAKYVKVLGIPVIMASGFPERIPHDQVAQAGISMVLPKPCLMDQLLTAITSHLKSGNEFPG
jgi:PAS domain S-box-containing protein